jgi:hypothetical protein
MLANHSLAKHGTTPDGNPDEKVGFDLIQLLVKEHKSHRNVTDSDSLFVYEDLWKRRMRTGASRY